MLPAVFSAAPAATPLMFPNRSMKVLSFSTFPPARITSALSPRTLGISRPRLSRFPCVFSCTSLRNPTSPFACSAVRLKSKPSALASFAACGVTLIRSLKSARSAGPPLVRIETIDGQDGHRRAQLFQAQTRDMRNRCYMTD